jgi:lactoylglutathione lyase
VASKLFPMLSCGDVDGVFARAREEGYEAVSDPADMPWGERVAWIADPDGNLVMLTR